MISTNPGALDPASLRNAFANVQYPGQVQGGTAPFQNIGLVQAGNMQGALGGGRQLVMPTSMAQQQSGQTHYPGVNIAQQIGQYGGPLQRMNTHTLVNGLAGNLNTANAATARMSASMMQGGMRPGAALDGRVSGLGALQNLGGNGAGNLAGMQAWPTGTGGQQNYNVANMNQLNQLNRAGFAGNVNLGMQGLGNHQGLQQANQRISGLAGNFQMMSSQAQGVSGQAGVNNNPDLLAVFGKANNAGQGLNSIQGLQNSQQTSASMPRFTNNQLGGGLAAGNYMMASGNSQRRGIGNVHPTHANQAAASATKDNDPPYDANDFPSLGGVNRSRFNPEGVQMGGQEAQYSFAALRKASGAHQEFSLQSPEEFPSLQSTQPGQNIPGGQDERLFTPPMQSKSAVPSRAVGGDRGSVLTDPALGKANYDHVLNRFQQQQQLKPNRAADAALENGGERQTPSAAAPATQSGKDRFGLLGLLSVIRMTDPDLTMLALGTDLTGLGLNLNSSDSLYKTFQSPLANTPIKSEPEFEVPECYKHPVPRLQAGFLSKFKEETLFYIFYSLPQDEAQMVAADELYSRGWWYHKKFRCWFIRAPNSNQSKIASGRGERGSYLFFDASIWDIVPKSDMEIMFEDIEVLPRLPRLKHMASARHQ